MLRVFPLKGMPERYFEFPVGVDLAQFLEPSLVVVFHVGLQGVVCSGHVFVDFFQIVEVHL